MSGFVCDGGCVISLYLRWIAVFNFQQSLSSYCHVVAPVYFQLEPRRYPAGFDVVDAEDGIWWPRECCGDQRDPSMLALPAPFPLPFPLSARIFLALLSLSAPLDRFEAGGLLPRRLAVKERRRRDGIETA